MRHYRKICSIYHIILGRFTDTNSNFLVLIRTLHSILYKHKLSRYDVILILTYLTWGIRYSQSMDFLLMGQWHLWHLIIPTIMYQKRKKLEYAYICVSICGNLA